MYLQTKDFSSIKQNLAEIFMLEKMELLHQKYVQLKYY